MGRSGPGARATGDSTGDRMTHWTLETIPWETFDPSKVDPELVKIVKAASMVEANGADYGIYLCSVFADDPEFQAAARTWAQEEVRHGMALARWAKLADPSFDFDSAFERFRAGVPIQTWRTDSIRGSRSGELVARCIVETGTSSYYSALMDATDEPVLKEVCRHIAADEFRHYRLFYRHLKSYLAKEKVGPLRRFVVALSRITESEDDELAYAYYTANHADEPYVRRRFVKAYLRRAFGFYKHEHLERSVGMALKAVGLRPNGRLNAILTGIASRWLRYRIAQLARAGA
jgi:rubrerythrin